MPNDLKTKIYFWIFGPVYKRIFDEAEAGMKELDRKQKLFQDKWGTRFKVDESGHTPAETVGATRK